jgi:hypothetical protein
MRGANTFVGNTLTMFLEMFKFIKVDNVENTFVGNVLMLLLARFKVVRSMRLKN